jgi:hypothetical protein
MILSLRVLEQSIIKTSHDMLRMRPFYDVLDRLEAAWNPSGPVLARKDELLNCANSSTLEAEKSAVKRRKARDVRGESIPRAPRSPVIPSTARRSLHT